jgi:hypothetical protein
MNPDTKLLLEEMRKEFAEQKKEIRKEFMDHDTKWEARISAVEKQKDDCIDALESAAVAFESWKPTIESSVQIVKTEVQKLSRHWDRAVKEKADAGCFLRPRFQFHRLGRCLRAHLLEAKLTAMKGTAGSTIARMWG